MTEVRKIGSLVLTKEDGRLVDRLMAEQEPAPTLKLQPAMAPPMGWETGFTLLLSGYCPYCGFRVSALQNERGEGLTWSCLNGCNP